MRVQEGQADNVQPLLDEMVAATKSDEQGALHYEYYMNEDRSTCTVLERYADNAAVMVHLGNFGAKFANRFLAVFAPERLPFMAKQTMRSVQHCLALAQPIRKWWQAFTAEMRRTPCYNIPKRPQHLLRAFYINCR